MGEEGVFAKEDGVFVERAKISADRAENDGNEKDVKSFAGLLAFDEEEPEEEGPKEVELFFD